MLVVKNMPANAGDIRDVGLISASGTPLQYSCQEQPKDRGAGVAVQRVATK